MHDGKGDVVLGGAALLSATVAAFDPDADVSDDLAYRLMINTPVTLFWRSTILDDTVEWVRSRGYQIVRLEASALRRLRRSRAARRSGRP
jgi:hypothetical protein